LTFDNHNSINGIREFAAARGADIDYVPLTPGDLRVDEQVLRDHLAGSTRRRGTSGGGRTTVPRGLLAFPAQSNFTGVQHSLELVDVAHEHGYDVLLDAAAFVPTNRLDLSRVHPDFVPVSWYKVFGYPTGVGCLIARREALAQLRRPWFSGGTIQAVSVQGLWHLLALNESAFEDGTLNYLCIPDVKSGLAWLRHVDLDLVHQRVGCLTDWLLRDLSALRHHNNRPVVRIYGPAHLDRRGATVAFNFLDPSGQVVDERAVSRDSSANHISLRTGCFCNPGAGEAAFAILKETLTGSISHQPHTIDEYLTLLGLPSAGAIRVSFGLASNLDDLDHVIRFAERTYVDRYPDRAGLTPRLSC
jgi:selenocysteine lyase/cysteine desulfurase